MHTNLREDNREKKLENLKILLIFSLLTNVLSFTDLLMEIAFQVSGMVFRPHVMVLPVMSFSVI